MSLSLYAHPFSSYCWKALIALYENGTPFTYRVLEAEDPQAMVELQGFWPLKRFPLLRHGERTVIEATSIIEHLQVFHPGPAPLIPLDAKAAVEVRMLDRVFDNYVMTPMQVPVADAMRDPADRDPTGVAKARAGLDAIYVWLDERMRGREWAVGEAFSLADCAAAPSLFYADWAHPIPGGLGALKAYRARLLARPSVARAVEEARPFRAYFPLGAPDRD
ncbi:glutathione S-transferase family protein [soil metagenome]